MNKTTKRYVLFLFYVLLVFLIILTSFVLVLGCLIIYLRLTSNETKNEESTESFPHVVTEYSMYSNKTRSSLAYLPYQIPENEYIEYRDENGNNYLVHQLLQALFMCHGVCYCIDKDGKGLKEQMIHMVPAGSFLEAYEIVRQVTPRLCAEVFHNDDAKCSTIPQGEFASCVYSEGYGEEYKRNSIFLCKGDCVVSKEITDQFKKRAKDVCNDLWLENVQVRLDCDMKDEQTCSRKAHEIFMKAFQVPFCTEVPHVSVRFLKEKITSVFKTIPLCGIDKPECVKVQ